MAFVSIDNPDGIQHHGGQMDWCRISATRVVMINYTKDNKALLQEINYVGGATVLGTPTFLKQVPAGGPTYRHLRSFVRDMGAGRVFVMVPTTFANMVSQGSTTGIALFVGNSSYSFSPTCGTPTAWTCMTAVRNSDGTYTVDSSIDINMAVTATANYRDTRGAPIDIFISGTQILIRSFMKTITANRFENKATLTLAAGKITAQAVTQTNTLTATAGMQVMGVRERRTPAGDVVRVYTYVSIVNNSGVDSWNNSGANSATAKLIQNPYDQVADLPWPNVAIAVGTYANPAAWLPISKTDPLNSLHVGSVTYFNNGLQPNYLNGNYTDGGTEVLNPLDAAWVTNNVACVVGYAAKYDGTANMLQPMYMPGDMAFTVHPSYFDTAAAGYGTVVRKLSLSFRSLVGSGIYAGPFEPLDTGMYFKNGMNCGDMIHRIDDTAFWLIGCFMDSPTADPKLGVITVKA